MKTLGAVVLACILVALPAAPAPKASAQSGATLSFPRILRVAPSGDLQAALDAARPGDFIELPAGATYVGNFVLPYKSGRSWVAIYSSGLPRLPGPGTAMSPDHARFMARIVSPNASPAVRTAPGAHHYVLAGIEITTTSGALTDLVFLDFPGQTIEQIPTDIVLYRCYIHGNSTGQIRRGVALNGARLSVIGSYLSDFHHTEEDSHAIQGWNGPGPFWIVGNYLEGAGANVMFGGAGTTIPDLVPTGITIRGNRFSKPLAWREGDPSFAGIRWSVKNLLELKNARQVRVEGNVFEHNWPQTQHGFAIVLTPRNQSGEAPWSTVEDVVIANNLIRRSTAGINVLGWDNFRPSGQARRIVIRHNLFEGIGAFAGPLPNTGVLFLVSDGPADLVIDHNTAFQTGHPLRAATVDSRVLRWPAAGFVFTNNLVLNDGGVAGNGTALQTLAAWFPGSVFARNAFVGGSPADYPPPLDDNFFPGSVFDVGFVDYAGGDYRLAEGSLLRGQATDGTDIGANIAALTAALLRWW